MSGLSRTLRGGKAAASEQGPGWNPETGQKPMDRGKGGVLLVDKGPGETSYAVVRKVRRLLDRRVKVGHAGTLDPLATGLLVVLMGQGTKLSRFLMEQQKVYLAAVCLGVETDTLDREGTPTRRATVPELPLDRIQQAALDFVGEVDQRPPAFSAVKIRGQRAYRLARRGEIVAPEPRKVTIHELEILSVKLPEVWMRVRCSHGTYVRSLAADLSRRLGTVGHLQSLRRLASGTFRVADALPSHLLEVGGGREALQRHTIGLADALPEVLGVEASETLARKVRQGMAPSGHELGLALPRGERRSGRVKLLHRGELVAILELRGQREGGDGRLKVLRVFH